MKKKNWIMLAATAALLLAGALALWKTGFFDALDSVESVQRYFDRGSPWGELAFFGVQLVSVILAPIPSNVTAAAGAVCFGMWTAFFLTWAAVLMGSVLVFLLARNIGQSFASALVSGKLSERYQSLIRGKRDTFLVLTFLFPFFPDDLICILAGMTDIPFRRFFLIVLLTRPWGLLVSCAVGSSTLALPWWGLALIGAAGLAVFCLSLKYGDKIEDKMLQKLKK